MLDLHNAINRPKQKSIKSFSENYLCYFKLITGAQLRAIIDRPSLKYLLLLNKKTEKQKTFHEKVSVSIAYLIATCLLYVSEVKTSKNTNFKKHPKQKETDQMKG